MQGKGDNKADYYSKRFCATHHREQRPNFLIPRKVWDAFLTASGKAPHVYYANERVC